MWTSEVLYFVQIYKRGDADFFSSTLLGRLDRQVCLANAVWGFYGATLSQDRPWRPRQAHRANALRRVTFKLTLPG